MKRTPKVVITNATNRTDYSEAKAFGELRVMSEKLYSFTPNSLANSVLSQDVASVTAGFDPELDYILPSGSAISTALLLVGLFARGIRKVKVLLWSGNDQNYHGGVLDLDVALGSQDV